MMVKLCVALADDADASVARTVNKLVLAAWARVGCHTKNPLVELMRAPAGAASSE